MNEYEEMKNIRCKCGNQWGLEKFRSQTNCKRCKTPVIARGELGNKNRERTWKKRLSN